MDLREITDKQKKLYNQKVTHIMQSFEWGEFRKSLGLPLLRYGIFRNNNLEQAFQLTLHQIPFSSQFVGYLPKGPQLTKELADALLQIGKDKDCAFIKVEPNILASLTPYSVYSKFLPSPKPLFTKYNFILDLTPSEERLLKNMSPKTRYNIRLAQKKGVKVEERIDDQAFEIFLRLHFETTKRQGFFSHNEDYHRKLWHYLKTSDMARLLIAFYQGEPLSCWLILNFKDTLYYPFGGSTDKHKEVMANNLVAWEAIRLGKRLKLKQFDLWGALGPEASPNDPWQGFHKFKKGYGATLVEYLGTFDLIFNNPLYWAFTLIDRATTLKVFLLKMLGK